MTRRQFLRAFRRVAPQYRWRVTRQGWLRTWTKVSLCPIDVVDQETDCSCCVWPWTVTVMYAADMTDGGWHRYDRRLRRTLLRIAGVG